MHEKSADKYLDPVLLDHVKSRIAEILANCETVILNSKSGDEVIDKLTPAIDRLLDYKEAMLRELSGFHLSGLKELLSKNP